LFDSFVKTIYNVRHFKSGNILIKDNSNQIIQRVLNQGFRV